MVGWLDVGWLEKAELKPTQPSLAGAWLSLAIFRLKGDYLSTTHQIIKRFTLLEDQDHAEECR